MKTAKNVIYEQVVKNIPNLSAAQPVTVTKVRKPLVFISYCSEDKRHALKIYKSLRLAGFDPWVDKEKLVVGQNWWRAIERAIRASDYCIFLFSSVSTTRRSFFNRELRFALTIQQNTPIDQTFILPVMLEECKIPVSITEEIQIVKLHPYKKGMQEIKKVLNNLGRPGERR